MILIAGLWVLGKFLKKKSGTGFALAVILSGILHLVLIGYLYVKSAEPEELFFALLLCTALAITFTRGKEGGKDGI